MSTRYSPSIPYIMGAMVNSLRCLVVYRLTKLAKNSAGRIKENKRNVEEYTGSQKVYVSKVCIILCLGSRRKEKVMRTKQM